MYLPIPKSHRQDTTSWYSVCTIFLIVISGLGSIAALIFWLTLRKQRRIRYWGIGVGLVWLSLLILFSNHYPVYWVWILSIPSMALGAEYIAGVQWVAENFIQRDLETYLKQQQKRVHSETLKQSKIARKRQPPTPTAGRLVIGSKIAGQPFLDHSGITLHKNWYVANENILDQHIFLLGAPGSGKSETLKRIVWEILHNTQRDVFVVDGKGDEQLATAIQEMTYQIRGETIPIVRLGYGEKGNPYNPLQGKAQDIFNRLVAMLNTAEASGGAEYYASVNRDLLQLVCYAPVGPPRNLQDLRQRLTLKWLMQAYSNNPQEQRTIRELKDHLKDLSIWLRPLIRDFGEVITENGFTLEESGGAIFSIRTQSVGDTGRRFLNLMIEDFKDWMSKRQQRPAVFICDEFGQFENRNIPGLLSLARSSMLGIILATQDTSSLTDERTSRRIQANTRTKILMATDFPEELGELAGTVETLEHSFQHQEGEITGLGSSRLQHQRQVSLNEVAQLAPGQAFLIRQRQVAKIQIRQI